MIRYFVSSTFRDMQYERDMINRVVLPQLQHVANERGKHISVTDLRWGIDTENLESEVSMQKILSVCMQEIEKSFPHFVVMLGERYGSVPSQTTIRQFLQSSQGKAFSYEEALDKSITELELIHFLRHMCEVYEEDISDHLTICLRNPMNKDGMPEEAIRNYFPESPEEADKAETLRAALVRDYPDSVIRYSAAWNTDKNCPDGLEVFSSRLAERLNRSLLRSLPELPLSPMARRQQSDEYRIQQCVSRFVLPETSANVFDSFLEGIRTVERSEATPRKHAGILVLFGEKFRGKTMHAAAMVKQARETPNRIVIPVMESETADKKDFFEALIWRLEESTASVHTDTAALTFNALKCKLNGLVDEISQQKHILFVLDCVEKYAPEDRKVILHGLPFDNRHVSFVLTCRCTKDIAESLPPEYEVQYCNIEDDSPAFIEALIRRESVLMGKELSDSVIKTIQNDSLYRSPLYTRLLLHRLSLLNADDFRKIEKMRENDLNDIRFSSYISSVLQQLPAEEQALANEIMHIAGMALPAGVIPFLQNTLWLLPQGLRAEDFVKLSHRILPDAPLTPLDISILCSNCRNILETRPDGRICFSHAFSWHDDAVADRILPRLCEYLNALPLNDPIKTASVLPICIQAGRPDLAADYLIEQYGSIETKKRKENLKKAGPPLALDSERYDALDISMSSLAHSEVMKKSGKSADTILSILNLGRAGDGRRQAYLVSAFLFTFDTLFENMQSEDKERVMDAMYRICMESIYFPVDQIPAAEPERSSAVLQFRTCYVCCEQCGIRVSNYGKMLKMYQEFHCLSAELLAVVNPEEPVFKSVLDDYCISVEKLAGLRNRSLKDRVHLLDQAYSLYTTHSASFERNEIARKQILNRYQKADIIINNALEKKQIGWPDDVIAEYVPFIRSTCRDLIQWSTDAKATDTRGYWHCEGCRLLADLERILPEPDQNAERQYTLEMIHAAERWYRESGNTYALDRKRNGLFRLILETPDLSDDIKRSYYRDMFKCQDKNMDEISFERMSDILAAAVKETVAYYGRLLKRWSANVENSNDISLMATICVEVLEMLHPITYKAVLQALSEDHISIKTAVEFIYQRSWRSKQLAEYQMIEYAKNNDFEQALHFASLLESLLRLTEPLFMPEDWLRIAIRQYKGIAAVWHNYRVYSMDSGHSWRNFGEKKYKYICLENYCKLCLLAEDPNMAASKCSIYSTSFADDIPEAWILAAVKYFSGNLQYAENFWKIAAKAHYYLAGGKNGWLGAMENMRANFGHVEIAKIGRYMTDNITQPRVKKLLAYSDLFETIALEYAYQNGLIDVADSIIYNGYSNFLELPLLLVIRKYDRKTYEKLFPQLSYSCLYRLRKSVSLYSKEVGFLSSYLLAEIGARELAELRKYCNYPLPHTFDLFCMGDVLLEDGSYLLAAFGYTKEGLSFAGCDILSSDRANFAEFYANLAAREMQSTKQAYFFGRAEILADSFKQAFGETAAFEMQSSLYYRKRIKSLKRLLRRIAAYSDAKHFSKENLLPYAIGRCFLFEQSWQAACYSAKTKQNDSYGWANNVVRSFR